METIGSLLCEKSIDHGRCPGCSCSVSRRRCEARPCVGVRTGPDLLPRCDLPRRSGAVLIALYAYRHFVAWFRRIVRPEEP